MSPKDQVETGRAIPTHRYRLCLAEIAPVGRTRDQHVITGGDGLLQNRGCRRKFLPLAHDGRGLRQQIPEKALDVSDAETWTFAAVGQKGPYRDLHFTKCPFGTAEAILQLCLEIVSDCFQQLIVSPLDCPLQCVDVT